MPTPPFELQPTGTGGPAPRRQIAVSAPPQKIPFDVAFREAVALVKNGLEAAEDQWNDEARQGMVSTILIAAAQHGWLTVWERPDAA